MSRVGTEGLLGGLGTVSTWQSRGKRGFSAFPPRLKSEARRGGGGGGIFPAIIRSGFVKAQLFWGLIIRDLSSRLGVPRSLCQRSVSLMKAIAAPKSPPVSPNPSQLAGIVSAQHRMLLPSSFPR